MDTVVFNNPPILWLMTFSLPLLILFLWWNWRRKQALISQFVTSRLLDDLRSQISFPLRKLKLALLVAGVALLFLTLARPQWGYALEEARQSGRDILVAVDTSRSMLATDIQPNRLVRAKLAALDLMKRVQGDRMGLIAFSSTAFLQCPLTLDDEAFRQNVDVLSTGILPQGGSSLASAIQAAREAFQKEETSEAILVLLTDGEDHEAGAVDAARAAAAEGIRIFTIGVGTANGELLRIQDPDGTESYLKDPEGNVVKSRLNESLLTQIATEANGFYLRLSGSRTMEVLHEKGFSRPVRGSSSSHLVQQLMERFQWPLAFAIALLILECLLPQHRKTRRTTPKNQPLSAAHPRTASVLVGLCFITTIQAAPSPQHAQELFQKGEYQAALQAYQSLLQEHPADPVFHYNAGISAYRADDFETAATHFSTALASPDLALQQQAHYNLGNARFRQGERAPEPDAKLDAWRDALRQFDAAAKLQSDDEDAIFNHDLVKQRIEELEEQMQQQQQQQQQQQDQQQQEQSDEDQQQQPAPQEQPDQEDQDQQQQDQTQQPNQNQDQSDSQQQQNQPPSPDQQQNQGQQGQDEQQQPGSAPPQDQPPDDQTSPSDSSAQSEAVPLGRMSPEQAKQLLQAHQDKTRALILTPNQPRSEATKRPLKDW